MEHSAHLVDVLNEQGEIIGQKARRDIDKIHDIHHGVHVILVTPTGELVLGSIPAREDLPNLYPRKLGATVATIRRHNETAEQAAIRTVSRELFIDEADVHLLGEKMFMLHDGRRSFITAYYLVADPPSIYSIIDIDGLAVVNPQQFRGIVKDSPEELAPTMLAIWQEFGTKLPL